MVAGTPIAGEAGVGYTIRRDYDLPPLVFDAEELEALILGARLVGAFGDESLVGPARSAISKVEAVLPQRLKVGVLRPALYAPRTYGAEMRAQALGTVRAALTEKRKLKLRYQEKMKKNPTARSFPWARFFGGEAGRLPRGASSETTFATFGSIGYSSFGRWTKRSPTSRFQLIP